MIEAIIFFYYCIMTEVLHYDPWLEGDMLSFSIFNLEFPSQPYFESCKPMENSIDLRNVYKSGKIIAPHLANDVNSATSRRVICKFTIQLWLSLKMFT